MDRIETDRLMMRPLSEDDATFYCDLYGDPHAMHFVGPPLSRERAERSFRIVLASRVRRPVVRLSLAIVEKASQQAIGIGGYRDFDARRRRVEAGRGRWRPRRLGDLPTVSAAMRKNWGQSNGVHP